MAQSTELLPGTLDLLILRTLALGPLHGVGVADRLAQVTRGAFRVGPGSLFTALHRMEEKGWLHATWGETPEGRRAKFYELTRAGRLRLERETARWRKIAWAMDLALAAGTAQPPLAAPAPFGRLASGLRLAAAVARSAQGVSKLRRLARDPAPPMAGRPAYAAPGRGPRDPSPAGSRRIVPRGRDALRNFAALRADLTHGANGATPANREVKS